MRIKNNTSPVIGHTIGLPRLDAPTTDETYARVKTNGSIPTNLYDIKDMFDGDDPLGEAPSRARRQLNADDTITDFVLGIEFPRRLSLIDTVNGSGLVNPRGAYAGGVAHAKHDIVTSAGKGWIAKRAVQDVVPAEGDDWGEAFFQADGTSSYPTLKTMTWTAAIQGTRSILWEGSGWRLPNLPVAYMAFVSYGWLGNPPVNPGMFPHFIGTGDNLWCSDRHVLYQEQRSSVIIGSLGDPYYSGSGNSKHAWPIRRATKSRQVSIVNNPYAGINWTTVLTKKGNFHCHTTDSDGGAAPAEQIAAYEAAGYDVLALTDHDVVTVWPTDPATIDMVAVQGEETTSWGHVTSLFSAATAGGADLNATLAAIVAAGGLGGLAHLGHTFQSIAGWDPPLPEAGYPWKLINATQTLFQTYWANKVAIAQELNSFENTGKFAATLATYDRLLKKFSPWTYFPLFGVDDSHIAGPKYDDTSGLCGSTNILLAAGSWDPAGDQAGTLAAVKAAFAAGQSYAVFQTNELGAAPVLNSFTHDTVNRKLVVAATNYTSIEWYGENGLICTGREFHYDQFPALRSSVRVVIKNGETGMIYLNPVIFNQMD